ncbi:MAG: hypothetical protein IJR66_00655 [Clostridia bacterium]|nr:hypothetical protein [Clostridia bacterium]
MKKLILLVLIFIPFLCFSGKTFTVKAENLNETIDEQLEILDLSEISRLIDENSENIDFNLLLTNVLKGNFDSSADNVYKYVIEIIGKNFKLEIKNFILIISLIIFVSLINNVKTDQDNGVKNIVNLISVLSVVIILSTSVISVIKKVKNVIKILSELNEIMSPVILTLMIASGGHASAGIYKPIVNILSDLILNNVMIILLPIILLIIVFGVLSNVSSNISFSKYTDLLKSVYKWIIGITVAVFGIFITAQGIASNSFDGISFKITKYALSNSVPIIGGFLGGGIDFFVAGSTLIKNSIGLIGLFFIIEILINPIINLAVLSLILKLVSAIAETLNNKEISNVISSFSTGITYLNITLIITGVMTFITLLLLVISANFIV